MSYNTCEEGLETRPPLFIFKAAQRSLSGKIFEDKELLDEVIASMMQDPYWKKMFSSDFKAFRAESRVRVGRLKLRRAAEEQDTDRDASCSDFITSQGGCSISTIP